MFNMLKPSRPLRSAGAALLVVPRVKTKQGEMAFSHYAARCWNQLPLERRSAQTVTGFKQRLKKLLHSPLPSFNLLIFALQLDIIYFVISVGAFLFCFLLISYVSFLFLCFMRNSLLTQSHCLLRWVHGTKKDRYWWPPICTLVVIKGKVLNSDINRRHLIQFLFDTSPQHWPGSGDNSRYHTSGLYYLLQFKLSSLVRKSIIISPGKKKT